VAFFFNADGIEELGALLAFAPDAIGDLAPLFFDPGLRPLATLEVGVEGSSTSLAGGLIVREGRADAIGDATVVTFIVVVVVVVVDNGCTVNGAASTPVAAREVPASRASLPVSMASPIPFSTQSTRNDTLAAFLGIDR